MHTCCNGANNLKSAGFQFAADVVMISEEENVKAVVEIEEEKAEGPIATAFEEA